MELLLSSILPIRPSKTSFSKRFEELLQETDKVCIASGYVSAEALTELKGIAEANNKLIELVIGMHYFEGITKVQYQAAKYLNEFLISNSLGRVYVANIFKFHGKMYVFHKDRGIFAGIMGSSNLNSMLDTHRSFETDVMLKDTCIITEINDFIVNLISNACIPLNDWEPEKFNEINPLLEGHENVEHCSADNLAEILNSTSASAKFDIPIKPSEDAPKSNVNAYFGKGRKNQRGFVKPRHWYEVEIIVPKKIADHSDYPKAGYPKNESVITVYTDDGWKFNCKISGDYSKNFRSCYDLKILGKWIKGRLENHGVLKIGEPVTKAVLQAYGRNSMRLIGTSNPQIWYLDFDAGGAA